ncbi:CLUMA_CG005585, isoform A [Clunio marinus]|uniref:CLUMA_CG005585, isoform A n=1 Tax=Clunio marinus TaxID=568069 RepID=A0A1J1HVF4_9DIPT|nr:CLUMA_CG005585, isoform A [Clunio marinus]
MKANETTLPPTITTNDAMIVPKKYSGSYLSMRANHQASLLYLLKKLKNISEGKKCKKVHSQASLTAYLINVSVVLIQSFFRNNKNPSNN